MEQAIVKKKSGISAIWILPFIALIVGGWIGYTSYRDKGEVITIIFDDISGVTAGKTQVIHKGLPIGMVKGYKIDYENAKIHLQVEVAKELTPHLYEDIQFWIVRPEVSASRISGLDTLLSGSYIALKPGTKSKKPARVFTGLDSPPPIPEHSISHHITLTTTTKGSLSIGAPILFKKIKVGEVVGVTFTKDHPDVTVEIVIYKDHRDLVTDSSYFWNASGIHMTADLKQGINVNIGTLETLLAGGISFATPLGGNALDQEPIFKLYANKDDALDSSFIQITLNLPTAEGIDIDTPIKYKGVVIGNITAMSMDESMEIFTAEAAISPKAKRLLRDDSDFWLESKGLSLSMGSVKSLLEGTYIAMIPGTGEPAHNFTVKSNPPKLLRNEDELIVILRTPRLGSLNIGSPILYRQIVVGKVSSFSLARNSQYVEIFIKIDGPYTPLVRERSKFWMASGIRVKGGLMTTMEIATESLESLMTGGIAFATPNDAEMGVPVDTGYQYNLHEDVDEKWLEWAPEIPISFYEDTIPMDFRLPMVEQEQGVQNIIEKITPTL